MICRRFQEGEKLDVAGLNEITVLIDRSETELTEVALNAWRKELKGPPHRHERKEQIFLVVSGEGTVKVADETFPAAPDDFIYVPAGTTHQTITTSGEPLTYLLFNAFLDFDKEGHASYSDHVAKMKETRRKQADAQRADPDAPETRPRLEKRGRHLRGLITGRRFGFGSHTTLLLLDRSETERCEATLVAWPAGKRGPLIAHEEMEQVFFVLSGTGKVTVGNETRPIKEGDVIFVPRRTPHATLATGEELVYLCLNTIVAKDRYGSYEEMCVALSSL